MTLHIQKVIDQLHFDIIMFCKKTFTVTLEQEGEIVTLIDIWADAELVTLI